MASARTPESEHSMEEDDYLQVIVESETHQGYLFEPEYTDEQLQHRDQAAAATAATSQPGNYSFCEQQRVASGISATDM